MSVLEIKLSDEQVRQLADELAARLPNSGLKPLLVREGVAAQLLGVKQAAMRHWRSKGLIRCSTVGRPVLYSPADIETAAAFISSRGNDSESDHEAG